MKNKLEKLVERESELKSLVTEMESIKDLVKQESRDYTITTFWMSATILLMGAGLKLGEPSYLGIGMIFMRTPTKIFTNYNRTYPLSTLSEDVQNKTDALLSRLHDLGELKDITLTSSINTFLLALSPFIFSKYNELGNVTRELAEIKSLENRLSVLGFYSTVSTDNYSNLTDSKLGLAMGS
jgi:hypothetical protein